MEPQACFRLRVYHISHIFHHVSWKPSPPQDVPRSLDLEEVGNSSVKAGTQGSGQTPHKYLTSIAQLRQRRKGGNKWIKIKVPENKNYPNHFSKNTQAVKILHIFGMRWCWLCSFCFPPNVPKQLSEAIFDIWSRGSPRPDSHSPTWSNTLP